MAVQKILHHYDEHLFDNFTVGGYLWGYEEKTLAAINKILTKWHLSPLFDDKFGLFYGVRICLFAAASKLYLWALFFSLFISLHQLLHLTFCRSSIFSSTSSSLFIYLSFCLSSMHIWRHIFPDSLHLSPSTFSCHTLSVCIYLFTSLLSSTCLFISVLCRFSWIHFWTTFISLIYLLFHLSLILDRFIYLPKAKLRCT